MVLGIAGAAAAYQPQGGPAPRGDFRRGPELSQEDRAHFEAMRKIRAELRDELRKETPDKQRARTLFAKELDLRQEFREKGFRNCIENHDHSKGRCGWIARQDRRMGYGNGAWVKFIDEMEKIAPFYDHALITEGHRNPGFAVGEFKLVELPDPAQPGKWSDKYAGRIDTAKLCTVNYDNARRLLDRALSHSLRNRYTLEIYDCTNDLLYFPARVFIALEKYDKASAGEKAAALEELSDLCSYFRQMKEDVLDTYSETRFMSNGEGYIEGHSHHMHLASRTNNGDWVFLYELPMVKEIEKWIERQK